MEILNNLLFGFQTALTPTVLFYCFIGVLLGTFIGVIPGIGPLATISLLLPLTYHIDPTASLVMLAGIYYGAQYGGSITSILLNIPGEVSTSVTCLDGYPMAQQGRAGVALFITAIASFIGSLIGILILILFAPSIAEFGLSFGSPEYFATMLLGLVAVSTVTSESPLKGLSMVVLGLILGTVGIDVNTGQSRFDFHIPQLLDGISLAVLAIGMFGVTETIRSTDRELVSNIKQSVNLKSMIPTVNDIKKSIMPIFRGTAIGSFFGALPGTGPAISAVLSYTTEKRISKNPEKFGHGAVEGIVAPESANNSATQTSFVPTLSLGIPGDSVTALMLSVFIIHGIQPGPTLISQQPEIFWGLIASFIIGNFMLLILNIPLINVWASILHVPYKFLYPAILIFICLGIYSINNSTFDIFVVAIIGASGYMLNMLKFESIPLLVGFILGPIIEENFRRSLILSNGDLTTFISRPISLFFLITSFTLLAWSVFSFFKNNKL